MEQKSQLHELKLDTWVHPWAALGSAPTKAADRGPQPENTTPSRGRTPHTFRKDQAGPDHPCLLSCQGSLSQVVDGNGTVQAALRHKWCHCAL